MARMATERNEEAKRIGRLIAELRDARGWSQQDLAGKLGVGVSTVSRWERGLHRSYPENVTKLARLLKVKPGLLRPVEPDVETQLDRVERAVSQLDRQVRLLRGETAARDAEVLTRLDEGWPPIRAPRDPPQ